MGCLQLPVNPPIQPRTDPKCLPALTLPNHPPDTLEHLEYASPSEIPYTHLANLGKGQTSVVEKVLHTPTNKIFARKTHTIQPHERRPKALASLLHTFRNEVAIARHLARSPHIVRVVASYSTHDALAVILSPVADSGDLRTFIDWYPAVADPARKAGMSATLMHAYGCLASALAFMHAQRIRHRDIKPENILIHRGAVLFADFGISRDYSNAVDSATDGRPDAFTRRYCAPEVEDYGRRTSRSDVFSLGVVFLLVYAAVVGGNDVVKCADQGGFYKYVDVIQTEMEGWTEYVEVVECLKGMVKFEEADRMSAAEVVRVLGRGRRKYFCDECAEGDMTGAGWEMTRRATTDSFSSASSEATLAGDTDQVLHFVASKDKTLLGEIEAWKVQTSSAAVSKDTASTDSSIASLPQPVSPTETPPLSQPRRDSMVSVLSDAAVHPHAKPLQATVDDSLFKPHQALQAAAPPRADSTCDNHPSESALQRITYPPLTVPPQASQHTSLQSHRPAPFLTHHRMLRISKLHLPSPATTTLHTTDTPSESKPESECVLYEDRIYDFVLRKLGFGIRLSNRYPYGSILPSLRTFPIIPTIMQEWEFFKSGSLFEVQRALATGKLHPYVQDETGDNLLHLAIQLNRLDISSHLHTLGVLPTPLHTGRTLFQSALYLNTYAPAPSAAIIATLRFLITQCDHQPDFESAIWQVGQKRFSLPEEVTHWLSTAGIEYGLDADAVEEMCVRVALRRAQLYVPAQMEGAEKLMKRYMTAGVVRRIKQGDMLLADDLFAAYGPPRALPSWQDTLALGALWLRVLASYAVDIPSYLLREIDAHPEQLLPSVGTQALDRKLVAGLTEDGEFVLGWRTAGERAPGALLVGEFGVMGTEMEIGEWPFAEWGEEGGLDEVWRAEQKRMVRFWRKKMTRYRYFSVGRMPGSWVE